MRAWMTLALLVLAAPASAARLFFTGAETGPGNLTTTEWTAATSATISSTQKHSGTYALRTNPTASTQNARVDLNASVTSGTYFYRYYIYFVDFPASGGSAGLVVASSGDAGSVEVIMADADSLGIFNAPDSNSSAVCSNNLSLNTWYRVEFRHVISDTVGEEQLKVFTGDSTTADCDVQYGAANKDTLATNVQRIYIGDFGVSDTWDMYQDDLVINDSTTSVQNTWAGPGKTAMLVPNGEGATAQWTPTSGTDNGLMVDELPGAAPDDTTTQNTTSTAANVDRLTLTNMPAEVTSDAQIKYVQVNARVGGNGTTGSPTARLKLWDEAGTLTNGPAFTDVDLNGYQILELGDLLLYNAKTPGKTKANLDSFEAGYEDVTDTAVIQAVTALWVNVEWTEAAVVTCTAGLNLTLLGVGGCP